VEEAPLLTDMMGKRVLLEWVGVAPPELEEAGEDGAAGEAEEEEEWPDNVTYHSHKVGKMGAVYLVGYNQLGIEVRTGLDEWPYFISWNAVLQIELLRD
jgi:hypothetical protein